MSEIIKVTADWFSVGVPVLKAMELLRSSVGGSLAYNRDPADAGYVLRVRVYKRQTPGGTRITRERLQQTVDYVNARLSGEPVLS